MSGVFNKEETGVAFRYNVLNLPDTIQFRNGNQIRNLYDASGKKLGTEYFTQLTNITPLADGQIVAQSYLAGAVDQDGTAYIGNFEYKTLNGNASLTALTRIYNDEGYVESLNSPVYYYYQKDHLGNNREVWLANANTTVQRTQYYPSGLPWASLNGDNPDQQTHKYNGKEFVEMHGYDTYDYGARGYYAAIMRWGAVDPLAEKSRRWSPYNYCLDNPLRYIDPDGRYFWEAKNVREARQEAKATGGEFSKWTGQNGRTYASVDYSKADNYKGDNTVEVKVFNPEGKSIVEKVTGMGKSAQKLVIDNKSEILGFADKMKNMGDNATKAGLGMAAVGACFEGVGAAPGLAVAGTGGVMSKTGEFIEFVTEAITVDFTTDKRTINNAVGTVQDKVIDLVVKDIVPAPSLSIKQSRELLQEILKANKPQNE